MYNAVFLKYIIYDLLSWFDLYNYFTYPYTHSHINAVQGKWRGTSRAEKPWEALPQLHVNGRYYELWPEV